MSTQRQTYLEKAFSFTVIVLLLLASAGSSKVMDDGILTTASPFLQNSSTTDQAVNSSNGHSTGMLLVRPCGKENAKFCLNGGKCIHPQDSDRPFCNCTPDYIGQRCEKVIVLRTSSSETIDAGKVIAIIFGVIIVFVVLALVVCCFVKRRCEKSTPLIKAAASETSV